MLREDHLIPMVGEGWARYLLPYFQTPETLRLIQFVAQERKRFNVYPSKEDVFKAFRLTPFKDVRVCLLGQDPYHTPGMAHGLAFSVPEGRGMPPSLRNILQELGTDLGLQHPSTDLTDWAEQGVLLLNTVLTVREGVPKSHAGMGWEHITAGAIRELSEGIRPTVFVLWGSDARRYKNLIDPFTHWIIESSHPSPMSANRGGWFGTRPFSKINALLEKEGLEPIRWGTPLPL